MALQGSIYPATTQVLWVDSPTEMYWKARTYSTYNGKGWLSEHTVTEPLSFTPEFTQGAVDRLRREVTYTVTPLYASKKFFSGDQVLDVDRDVIIETQAPLVFTIDLSTLDQDGLCRNTCAKRGMVCSKLWNPAVILSRTRRWPSLCRPSSVWTEWSGTGADPSECSSQKPCRPYRGAIRDQPQGQVQNRRPLPGVVGNHVGRSRATAYCEH